MSVAHEQSGGSVAEITPLISARGVTIQRDGVEIVHDTDLDIRAPFTLIMGESGAGKSTLVTALHGLTAISTGQIEHRIGDGAVVYKPSFPESRLSKVSDLIFGINEDRDRQAYRSSYLGFVAQAPHLLGNLSALENVILPHQVRGNPVSPNTVAGLFEQMGLQAKVNQGVIC